MRDGWRAWVRGWRHAAWCIAACAGGLSARSEIIAGPLTSPVNGHVYYLLGEGSWQDAEAFAARLGGHLATVRSEEEQAWVFDQFGAWGGRLRSLWIGLRRTSPGGSFAWVSGEPIQYTHWLPGQPDNSPVTGGEGHVHLLNTGNAYGHPGGFWNDLASPNVVFHVFDPICGVVELAPTRDPVVALAIASDASETRLLATTPATTVRLVWETSPTLDPPSWNVVSVQTDLAARATWSLAVDWGTGAGFLRARAHDTPGFNARLDQVIRVVRATYPDAVLLEASPRLQGTVTGLPDSAGLRAVFRAAGGTVTGEQADPWGAPAMSFRAAPWMGSANLPWPVDMDLEEAESALRAAGFGQDYKTVVLRQPVYPGMTEPYFIFGTPLHGFVFVGTSTRRVFVGQ